MASTRRIGDRGTYGLTQETALVVAWHNRHPLALRIRPDQVRGIGWVQVPFVDPDAPAGKEPPAVLDAAPSLSLRERALQRDAPQDGTVPHAVSVDTARWQAAFSERLVPRVSPQALAAFARKHGGAATLPAHARPRRDVTVDQRLAGAGAGLRWLHLQTASVEAGTRRSRVFFSDLGDGTVLGGRLWSRARVAALALVPLLACGGAWSWVERDRIADAFAQRSTRPLEPIRPAAIPAATPPSAPASAQDLPAIAAATAPAAYAAPASDSAHVAAAASSVSFGAASSQAVLTGAPAPYAEPAPKDVNRDSAGRAEAPLVQAASMPPPSIRPRLDPDVARAARKESAALRALAQASMATHDTPAAESAPPTPARTAQRASSPLVGTARQMPAAAPAGPVYALVARTTRSRAASEILLTAMAGESARGAGAPRAEVLSAQGGYRASLWPFTSKEAAERAQERMRAAGLNTDIVEF